MHSAKRPNGRLDEGIHLIDVANIRLDRQGVPALSANVLSDSLQGRELTTSQDHVRPTCSHGERDTAAGIFGAAPRKITPPGWQADIDTTLNGTFYCSRAVGQHMIEHDGGKIINITATLHYKGSPGMIAPTAAKAGVEAMTKTLALEWAKFNILVNAIAPGPIQTEGSEKHLWSNIAFRDMVQRGVPLARFGNPEDIANMAVYLASPAGDYITGATMVVDGGEWLKKGMT
jgi:peroxisomal 2,4-dienoyl-CoA reductase